MRRIEFVIVPYVFLGRIVSEAQQVKVYRVGLVRADTLRAKALTSRKS